MSFSDFRHVVTRTDLGTVIKITDLDLLSATYLLSLCRKRFAWTHKEEFCLKWQGPGLNQEVEIEIVIPASKPGSRDPFTAEWVNGFFGGVKHTVRPKNQAELLELIKSLI